MTVAVHQHRASKRPERTCIGCRQKAASSDLLRLVRSPDGELVFDQRHRLGGRGAWVCGSIGCLTRALRSRRLGDAVGGAIRDTRPEIMVERIRAQVVQRVDGLLVAAGQARKVELGAVRTEEALRHQPMRVTLVVLATDVSPRVRRAVGAAALSAGVPIVDFGDRDRLGLAFARRELGATALTDNGLALAIRRELSLLDGLAMAEDAMKDLPVRG